MHYLKNLLVGLITGIAAYLNPVSGDIKSLLALFAINFLFGLLAGLLTNGEIFNFKKAFRCILEAMAFFVLISAIYFIGEQKGNSEGALQCVSFVTYSVFYFYGEMYCVIGNCCVEREALRLNVFHLSTM